MSKTLNVIQVIDSLAVGGAEMMAVTIANELVERGIDSHICVTRCNGELAKKIDKKVKCIYLAKKRSLDIKAFFRLKKYVKKNTINIVHVHSTSVFFCFMLKLFCVKPKYIWHNHTGINTELKKGGKFILLKFILNFYDNIVNVSKDLDIWTKSVLKLKKSVFIANFPSVSKEKKTELKLKKSNKIIILAAIRKEKDHFNLIRAFNLIQDKYQNWSLHIVGKIYNDVVSDELIKYIKENDLEKKVYLYGTVLDTSYVLSQSDIAVLSSYSEGLPVSLLEYGLAGLPVVVTNVGECKNVVGDNGLVVEKKNSKSLSLALEKYIINNNFRKEMGQKFQHHVDENYSKSSYFTNLLSLYNQ
ncbi:glycosyltransferase [Wenyingzhuangia aestuarii]|uniref:glycosyltransferase n=1 Tax=Wenyingzhuangia aestuarii TaxID=1647582 RepID=UPI001438B842|nr:glycosyltransferase [Wenyingzhuangia aestuarii]NJB81751.1 glycosyltransferase involved in cell wall biosynthesis [Wenyingzhuangia aestuarii]